MKSSSKRELDFGNDKIIKILLKLAPPVMLAQLIQALYNLIDSYFVGSYSESGLTALSKIYPLQLLMIALAVGTVAFRIIGISFIPLVTSLIYPVYFQAIGSAFKSSMLTILRTVVLLVPLGFIFSKIGLDWFWLTFPCTEIITTIVGFILYKKENKKISLKFTERTR